MSCQPSRRRRDVHTMTTNSDSTTLGVLTPDSARTILVIGGDGDMAVALRERIDRAYALVKDVRPEEAAAGFATCLPWPWMVVGNVTQLPDEALSHFHNRPILVLWRGPMPEGLPGHVRGFSGFTDLCSEVDRALTHSVAGMRLAIGLGVDLPGGAYARSAELQALVSAHPHGFDVPPDAFRSAARVLSSHNIPLKPSRLSHDGMVALMETAGATP